MLDWILFNKLYFILIILLDGLVLNHLSAKHREHGNGRTVGLDYFWTILKQGQADGWLAIILTGAAALSAVMLGAVLVLRG